MKKLNAVYRGLLGIVLAAALPMTASAISITFEATDIADDPGGPNLFRGSLSVSDAVFNAGEGFTVYFPAALYSDFTEPVTANPDWDVLTGEVLGRGPLYDGLAMVALAPTTAPFEFNFVFSGSGTPEGAFDFEVYNFDPFLILDEGQTTPTRPPTPLPEGLATGWALSFAACSLLGLAKIRRRK